MPIQTGQCPKCHAVNAFTAINCLDCRGRLPWADAVEEAQRKAAAQAAAQADLAAQAAVAAQRANQAALATSGVATPGGATPSGAPPGLAPQSRTGTTVLPGQLPAVIPPGSVYPAGAAPIQSNIYEAFVGSFLGRFSNGFTGIDNRRAMLLGLGCGAIYSLCFIIGAYVIRHQFTTMFATMFSGLFGGFSSMMNQGAAIGAKPQPGTVLGAVTFKGVFKLFLISCTPLLTIALCSALARKIFSEEEGSFGGDVFLAGITLLPLALLIFLTGLVGISNWQVSVIFGVVALSYVIILMYNGLAHIGRIRTTAAATVVPIMLLLTIWLTRIVVTRMIS